jgi:hypothetical protein
MYRKLCLLALSLFASTTLFAQVQPSAELGGGGTAQIGAEITTFNPDWGCLHSSAFSCWTHQLVGISPYMDSRQIMFSRTAVEAQARFLHWRGPSNVTESSYMMGPRVGLFRYRQISLNAKLMLGRAHITVPPKHAGTGNYFAYAPGGLLEYRLNRRLFIRGDYEYQFWPTWKGIHTATSDGTGALTPNGLSLGVSYALR